MSDYFPAKILTYNWRTRQHSVFTRYTGPSYYLHQGHFGGITVEAGDYIDPHQEVRSARWVDRNRAVWREII